MDAFRPANEFKSHMDNWITRFRSAKTIESEEKLIIPGDPEREMTKERLERGIPLNEKVIDDLMQLGEKVGVKF